MNIDWTALFLAILNYIAFYLNYLAGKKVFSGVLLALGVVMTTFFIVSLFN